MKDVSIVLFVAIISICVIGGVISRTFYGPDNYIEEFAEDVIQKQTGINLDLSPSTPEIDIDDFDLSKV